MALSNRDRISKGLELLREGLLPFVERELKARLGDEWISAINQGLKRELVPEGGKLPWDTYSLLAVLWDQWHPAFRHVLGPAQRSLVSELRDVRNGWAHERQFSYDQTYRGLDTMRMLLEAVSASEQAREVSAMAEETMRIKFTEQARSKTRRAAEITVEGQPQAGLKPWREVVTPHADVASGRYQQAEFAADLAQVHRGEGTSEYRDPVEFFRRTFITKGMNHLLTGGLRRISGQGGDPVVELQTNFGGGKTHTMLALYHLFAGGGADLAGMEPLYQEVGLDKAPRANRAVLVGTALGPAQPRTKHDGTVVRTLWGELAWQLGDSAGGQGAEAYAMIAGSDEAGVSPGKDDFLPLFDRFGPCLILIDEWVAYLRQLYKVDGLPAGAFDANLTFAQALTEAVKARPNVLLVASLPASQIEIGGEGGQEALERLSQTFSRVESPWKPADPDEGFEIVRRRLFEPIQDFASRDATVKAFGELYASQRGEFPSECAEGDYRRRLELAYPIHPQLFDVLYEDWSTLDKFQRTRGVLRLMAAVIHALWEKGDPNLMILPSTIPIGDPAVSFELLRYLDDNWEGVVAKDVDGEQSLSLQIDRDNPNLGRYSACRRVARTVFLGTAPLAGTGNPGIDARVVKLGSAQPGETVATFGDALRRLSDQATYLYVDGPRNWFATQANVTRTAADRAAMLDEADVNAHIVKVLREENRGARARGDFAGLHVAPENSADVPDETDTRLVLLGPGQAHTRNATDGPGLRAARMFLDQRGNTPRLYRNALVFLAPDSKKWEDFSQAVRQFLAWDSVVRDAESLNLTPFAAKQAKSKRDESQSTVSLRIQETWSWCLVPNQEAGSGEVNWDQTRLSSQGNLAERVSKKLAEQGALFPVLGPSILKLHLDKWLWKDQDHIELRKVREALASYLYLPRLTSGAVLKACVRQAQVNLINEDFAFAEGWEPDGDSGRYLGLRGQGAHQVTFSPGCLLVKPEVALVKDPVVPVPGPRTTGQGNEGGPGGTGETPAPAAPVKKRFFASATLDATRPTRHMGQLVEEVIQHLSTLPGATAKLHLEVQVEAADAIPEGIQRTVLENAKTLKMEAFGFEE